MTAETVIGLVVAVLGVNVAVAVGLVWKGGGWVARIEAKLEHVASSERVTKLETVQEEHGRRLDAHDDVIQALFERASDETH